MDQLGLVSVGQGLTKKDREASLPPTVHLTRYGRLSPFCWRILNTRTSNDSVWIRLVIAASRQSEPGALLTCR